jgi:hypothetical protein
LTAGEDRQTAGKLTMWDCCEEERFNHVDKTIQHEQEKEPQAATPEQGQVQPRTKRSQSQARQRASDESRSEGLKRFRMPAKRWQRHAEKIHGDPADHEGKSKPHADDEGPSHRFRKPSQ